jgi:hypothetical protein
MLIAVNIHSNVQLVKKSAFTNPMQCMCRTFWKRSETILPHSLLPGIKPNEDLDLQSGSELKQLAQRAELRGSM